MEISHLLITDAEVDAALADTSIAISVRGIWQLLWESEIRLREAVFLDVPGVMPEGRRVITFPTGLKDQEWEVDITPSMAARFDEVIGVRERGSVFLVRGRRLRVDEVTEPFRRITGKSVHALRYSRQRREAEEHARRAASS